MTNVSSIPATTRSLVEGINWSDMFTQLDGQGYALTGPVLASTQNEALIHLYADDASFRSRVIMQRHNFGSGEYKYFADPLPSLISYLQKTFYENLAPFANDWMERMNQAQHYPATYEEFMTLCREAGQIKPTPLLLRYEAGDYNCLHQDLYGAIAFPLQGACVLSGHGADYTGGEFLLNEQRPRSQTRGEAITLERGRFIIFPNRHRPVPGVRGYYRMNIKHGVSRLRSGTRYCLGIILHNAQ
ncbi:MAG: 2OG-Fe(II) oxygenase [Acidobacteriota bacterium]